MIFLYIIIVILSLYKIRYAKNGSSYNPLERIQTDSIKGIFIFFVFIRHIMQYIANSGYDYSFWGDLFVKNVNSMMGQFIVVMFLFYSGFGVAESIKIKGKIYINQIPQKRILPTFLNFNVALLFFLVIDLVLDRPFTYLQLLRSIICWDTIGNSNWYIFDILLCYFITFTSFRFFRKKALLVSLFLFVLVVCILSFVKQPWWSNTLFSFFAGIHFSMYKNLYLSFFEKKYWMSLFVLVCVFIGLYGTTFFVSVGKMAIYNAASIVFAWLIVLLTMKIRVSNKIITWLGVNLFPLYIYQRIPMIALFEINDGLFVRSNVLAYIVICMLSTCFFGYFYKYWQITVGVKPNKQK